MRNKLVSTLLLLLPALLSAQERVTVKGRIVNEQGDAVEYVQVGVPKRQIGTISTVDGHFEIAVPCDTLEFFHVSYMPAAYPVTGPADDVVIVLREQELPPAVFIGGNTKEKYLVHPGLKINEKIGGADTETFVNVLHKPMYVNIVESDSPKDYDIQPEEIILLEPGKYFVAIQIVATDDDAVHRILETPEAERNPRALHMSTALYFKSSYERYYAMGKMIKIPVNIGIAVKGLEYQ